MAIIKLGTIVTGVRGTIGGITFSQNQSSPYAKTWRKPVNPISPGQVKERALWASFPPAWAGMTVGNRAAWDAFAAAPAQLLTNSLGQTYSISGYAWFVRINTWGVKIGFALTTVVPVAARPAAPVISTMTVQNTPLKAEVTYPGGTFGASDTIVVYVAVWRTQTALTPPNNFRFLRGVFNPGAGPFDFKFQYQGILGAPIIGTKAFARIYLQNSQRYRSQPTAISANVTV